MLTKKKTMLLGMFVAVAVASLAQESLAARVTVTAQNATLNLGSGITLRATGVRAWTRGENVFVQFRYTIQERDNRTARVQLLVAMERSVVACVYDGVPGRKGSSRTVTVRIPKHHYNGGYNETPVHLVGMWCTSVKNAVRDYRNGGGHRGVIAVIRWHE